MNIATLRFDDKNQMIHALNGIDYYCAFTDFDNYLRGRIKYEDLPDEVEAALSEARRRLHEECPVIWDEAKPFKHKGKNLIQKIHGWLKHAMPTRRCECGYC